jgi:glycosyltransferase involved in cell wall biosynthesis
MTRIALYEVPLPSSRTVRVMSTLTAAGYDVSAVHHPRYADRVSSVGLGSIPVALGGGNPLTARVSAALAAAEKAGDERGARLWRAVQATPVPPLMPRPGDLDVLVHQWLSVAPALAAVEADVYWAADLDALPAVVWAAAAVPGSRVVLDAHELFPELDYLDPAQRPEWAQIARDLVPHVDELITVGDEMADRWRADYGARSVHAIGNLAPRPEPLDGPDLRASLGLDAATPLAVHVGNVVPNRRPELAVELLERWPELHVALVGEVRYGLDATLAELAEHAGVADRLHLVAPVPTAQLEPFVATADVALILYSPERSTHLRVTMPNKLFDALAAGVPVVATEGLAPARYLAERGLGRSFRDGDVDDLAAAVREVVGDEAMRDRARRTRAEARWPAVEGELLAVVADVAGAASVVHAEPARPEGAPAPRANPARPGRVRRAVAHRLRRLADQVSPR